MPTRAMGSSRLRAEETTHSFTSPRWSAPACTRWTRISAFHTSWRRTSAARHLRSISKPPKLSRNSGASACLCVRSFLFCHEGLLMSAYKDPSFQERTALARQARQTALDQLKAKPPADAAVLAARNAARIARAPAKADVRAATRRKDERRVGKEGVRTCRDGWSHVH